MRFKGGFGTPPAKQRLTVFRARRRLLVMRVVSGVIVVMCALALVSAAPARPLLPAQKAALEGIGRAAAKSRIDAASAAADRAAVNRAAALIRRLPHARSAPLAASLAQAAALAGKLTAPRALAVFGQLQVTSAYLARQGPPAPETDVTDADGVVYRWFAGRGFEFHPLANFGALNAAVRGGDAAGAERLAGALLARGVPQPGGGSGWEYYFDYAGGKAPWLSGMAQAVAAQAFAAAAALGAGDSGELLGAARAAYRTIPGHLVRQLPEGPWIKLYAFKPDVVLNAQLQAIVSLRDYAGATEDAAAADLSSRLEAAAATKLSGFDTGYWTYYSLPHTSSPLDYQRYVVLLLRKLGTADERFAAAAKRFAAYEKQPPAFKLADAGVGGVRFWLSKPASVQLAAVGPAKRLWLGDGWHTVTWKLPARPGAYPVTMTARDWAGNSASLEALPIVKVVPPAAKPPAASFAGAARNGATGGGTGAVGQPGFVVGAGLDSPDQARLARQEKLGAIRLSVPWPVGASAPDPAVVAALRGLQGKRLVVELVADPLPVDDGARSALASYAASLTQQVPSLRDLLLGPAPVAATAPAYVAALSFVYDAVKTAVPTVAVGGVLDGGEAPKATLTAAAAAYRTAGRPVPLFDELAFRAAPTLAKNAWMLGDYSRLTAALSTAFDGTAQAGASLPILLDGLAVQTAIPAAKAGSYVSPSTPPGGVSESEQAAAYAQALETAGCRPNVAGILLRRLVDSPEPGEQSGLFYADGTPKASAAAAASTFAAAARGTLTVCPGLAVPVTARTLVFPTVLSPSSAPAVQLGCTRDCLFLVTLDRADGKPVLARRGALSGGAAATTVRLAKLPLAAGSYTFSVRLVAQTNPGPVQLVTSPPLALG